MKERLNEWDLTWFVTNSLHWIGKYNQSFLVFCSVGRLTGESRSRKKSLRQEAISRTSSTVLRLGREEEKKRRLRSIVLLILPDCVNVCKRDYCTLDCIVNNSRSELEYIFMYNLFNTNKTHLAIDALLRQSTWVHSLNAALNNRRQKAALWILRNWQGKIAASRRRLVRAGLERGRVDKYMNLLLNACSLWMHALSKCILVQNACSFQ